MFYFWYPTAVFGALKSFGKSAPSASKIISLTSSAVVFSLLAFDRPRFQPFCLIPGGHIVFASALFIIFEFTRSSRLSRVPSRDQTSLASLRAVRELDSAYVLRPSRKIHPPPAPDFRPAELTAPTAVGSGGSVRIDSPCEPRLNRHAPLASRRRLA